MSNINNYNYGNIEIPYNDYLERAGEENNTVDSSGVVISGNNAENSEMSQEKKVNGNSFDNVWLKNWIKSTNYSPKKKGFYIDGLSGYIEAVDAYFSGTIESSTITGTNLIGGSLYIPNITTPLFSVDSLGNAEVASLRRKDFYWNTVFESVDGYSLTGAASVLGLEGVTLKTGATATNFAALSKQSTNFTGFTWDKKFSFKICLKIATDFNSDNQTFNFGRGGFEIGSDYTEGVLRKVGFNITAKQLYGVCADGSNMSSVSLMSTSTLRNASVIYEVIYDPTTGCSFYVNDVLKGTLATTLPAGTSVAGYMLIAQIETTENVAKTADIYYYYFWQAL